MSFRPENWWRWGTRGVLGAVGLIGAEWQEAVAPPEAIKQLEAAREQIDSILRQQAKKREQA